MVTLTGFCPWSQKLESSVSINQGLTLGVKGLNEPKIELDSTEVNCNTKLSLPSAFHAFDLIQLCPFFETITYESGSKELRKAEKWQNIESMASLTLWNKC